KEKVFYVEVHKIRANPDQPRTEFDEEALSDLASSIRKYGVLQPLLVTKREEATPRGLNVYYQLIAGERRLRASQKAGLPQVPVVIRDDIDDVSSKRLEIALIENLQRQDLNSMEEAEAFDRLQKDFGLSHEEIGQKVGKSRMAVSNTIRLLKLPDYAKDSLRGGTITMAHARALLGFESPEGQRKMYEQILQGGVSTKDVEAAAASSKVARKSKIDDGRFLELQKNLGTKLNTSVLIKAGERGGQLIIKFADLEDLNVIAKSIID
ncbi:MAG: ParB/RepB/Spo0J family partition protein, partial [Candidatus Yanofskybacteria bacterium]|nr:ParB/RepB/Spo0J family partition protein [Candidatus Yanofskybacteria bacterium]